VFADFAMQNDYPSAFYEEGADYPFAPPDRVVKVTGRNLGAQGVERLDHLTSRYIWFKPGSGVRPNAKLLVRMDGPAYSTGPEASVVVFYESGKVKFIPMPVSRQGVAEVTVPFGKGKIAEVDLVMTNASTRLENGDCWVDPKWRYSCAGFPRDDNMLYEYWIRARGSVPRARSVSGPDARHARLRLATPPEPVPLVEALGADGGHQPDERARPARPFQVAHHRVHDDGALAATLVLGQDDHVLQVEVQAAVPDDAPAPDRLPVELEDHGEQGVREAGGDALVRHLAPADGAAQSLVLLDGRVALDEPVLAHRAQSRRARPGPVR
jgi:hypothetical protein